MDPLRVSLGGTPPSQVRTIRFALPTDTCQFGCGLAPSPPSIYRVTDVESVRPWNEGGVRTYGGASYACSNGVGSDRRAGSCGRRSGADHHRNDLGASA